MIAVVDLDDTLVDGNAGISFVSHLLYDGLTGGVDRKFYMRLVPYIWFALLFPFRKLKPVYLFLQRLSTQLFFELEKSCSQDVVNRAIQKAMRKIRIPMESKRFIGALKQRGYTVVILSSSPQAIVDALVPLLGADAGYGISRRWGMLFDANGKAAFIRNKLGYEQVDLIVGNPGREPFWLGRRKIVVRSPNELNRWINNI